MHVAFHEMNGRTVTVASTGNLVVLSNYYYGIVIHIATIKINMVTETLNLVTAYNNACIIN